MSIRKPHRNVSTIAKDFPSGNLKVNLTVKPDANANQDILDIIVNLKK